MSLIHKIIKRNQRHMLLKRQSIGKLRTGCRIGWNRVDVTNKTIAELKRQIGDLVQANLILRDHLRHA